MATDSAASDTVGEAGGIDRSHAGEAAPDIGFTDLSGAKHTLDDFRGSPVLVNLWATWCAPCIKEMPTLDALASDMGDRLKVVPISQDLGGAEAVRPWFAKRDYAALQPYVDPDMGWSTTLGGNLPTTVLYDATGKEVWRYTGDRDWSDTESRKLIAEALR
ncbi:TlpA family protein disulfide reductase [Stakelama saccharophila]|uniref:TlpA disulfide reductase family protein n=1 Tax=Stakelama saccharophila TaxID=3075605 RepID=A0ABZ0B8I6_9SPHN|nr:TlpA disulfide reductase family protein [Stakelama sp. W311]WNO53714.1 TlpA disulfide reductase family protein [Stakelama sp. W311]